MSLIDILTPAGLDDFSSTTFVVFAGDANCTSFAFAAFAASKCSAVRVTVVFNSDNKLPNRKKNN